MTTPEPRPESDEERAARHERERIESNERYERERIEASDRHERERLEERAAEKVRMDDRDRVARDKTSEEE